MTKNVLSPQPVVVYHQSFWARGRVESVPGAKSGKAKVFLLDYGCTVEEQVRECFYLMAALLNIASPRFTYLTRL